MGCGTIRVGLTGKADRILSVFCHQMSLAMRYSKLPKTLKQIQAVFSKILFINTNPELLD